MDGHGLVVRLGVRRGGSQGGLLVAVAFLAARAVVTPARHGPNLPAARRARCAGSDEIARGVLDVLHQEGYDVPSQVAVIGFDNWNILAGSAGSGTETIPARLITRESTAPLF
ncbi:substrate-binding domain-containing protein [Actinoplanes sp. NPDC049596]|uniref:substrate-binding domain-containing protein n=1 Tax=unclassified Actinoplanes TaxID=2626549 RepID=UPI003415623A